MPIYGLQKDPWVPVKKLNKLDKFQYTMLLKRCLKMCSEHNNSRFIQSIYIGEYNDCIAYFDFSKTKIPVAEYQKMMEDLIYNMNNELGYGNNKEVIKPSKKYAGDKISKENDIKIDIMGNWTIGKIIVLKKNYRDGNGFGTFPTVPKFKSIKTFKTVKNNIK